MTTWKQEMLAHLKINHSRGERNPKQSMSGMIFNSRKFSKNFNSLSRTRSFFISLSLLDLDFQSFSFHFHYLISISSHFFSFALLEKSEWHFFLIFHFSNVQDLLSQDTGFCWTLMCWSSLLMLIILSQVIKGESSAYGGDSYHDRDPMGRRWVWLSWFSYSWSSYNLSGVQSQSSRFSQGGAPIRVWQYLQGDEVFPNKGKSQFQNTGLPLSWIG